MWAQGICQVVHTTSECKGITLYFMGDSPLLGFVLGEGQTESYKRYAPGGKKGGRVMGSF